MAPIFAVTGIVYPMWHTVTAAGDHKIINSPPGDKDTAALLIRAYFELHDVVRYVFVDEAWTLMVPTSRYSEMPDIMQRGLSDHPERVEVVMYQAEDASGAVTAHRNIIRPKTGKARLGPLHFFRSKQSEGRFVGMLPQRGTVQ
jgi:hypothetical protein